LLSCKTLPDNCGSKCDMMNIAILTLCGNGNYGASLQAYALNRVIRNLGFNCKTVDYRRVFVKGAVPHQSFRSKVETVFKQPSLVFSFPIIPLMNILIKEKLLQREIAFNEFETKNIPKTERKFSGSA